MEQISNLRSNNSSNNKAGSSSFKVGPAEHWQIQPGDYIKIKINSKEVILFFITSLRFCL
jgi:hypothetical protein